MKFSGSKKCGAGCGRTISANKIACLKCYRFALVLAQKKLEASRLPEMVEQS